MQFSESWYKAMVKRYLLYLFFKIKSVLKTLPRLAACTLVLSVAVLIAGLCGNKILNGNRDNTIHVKVAVVFSENDIKVNLGFNIFQNMDSLKNICTFVSTDMETALDMMEKGEVSAIAYIPENFVDGIMYGDNFPAVLITPENAGIETLLFCSIIDAGSHTLSYVQSGIYSVSDLLDAHGLNKYKSDAEEDLNRYYTKYALYRNEFFNTTTVSPTGNVSTAGYYISSGVILLLLLCTITASVHFAPCRPDVMSALKRCRIHDSYIKFSELLSVSLMFLVLLGIMLLISLFTPAKDMLEINFGGFAVVIFITFSVVSFAMFIYSLTDNRLAASLIVFISTAGMLYACGRIVPSVYLPDAVQNIGNFLPVKVWCSALESALFNGPLLRCTLLTLAITVVFFSGSVIAVKIKGRDY